MGTIFNQDMMLGLLSVLPPELHHIKFMRMRPTPEALAYLCSRGVGAVTCTYMRDTGDVSLEMRQRYMQVGRYAWRGLTHRVYGTARLPGGRWFVWHYMRSSPRWGALNFVFCISSVPLCPPTCLGCHRACHGCYPSQPASS